MKSITTMHLFLTTKHPICKALNHAAKPFTIRWKIFVWIASILCWFTGQERHVWSLKVKIIQFCENKPMNSWKECKNRVSYETLVCPITQSIIWKNFSTIVESSLPSIRCEHLYKNFYKKINFLLLFLLFQVEFHPHLLQQELLEFCCENEILLQAYSPLGSDEGVKELLGNPVVKSIASQLDRKPAQVLLRWSLQHGCCKLINQIWQRVFDWQVLIVPG